MCNKKDTFKIIDTFCRITVHCGVILYVGAEHRRRHRGRRQPRSGIGGTGPAPRTLDADEIKGLTIEYTCEIPVEAIVNNEPGYERYYNEMLESIELLSKEAENFPFYGEEGFYMSKAPRYVFNAYERKIHTEAHIVLF